jgi:putative ABC transport system substrate-binding protein
LTRRLLTVALVLSNILQARIYPPARRIAILLNPDNPINAPVVEAMGLTAKSLKLELQPFEARTSNEVENALSTMITTRVDAVAATSDSVLIANSARIAEIAANNRLPSIGFVELARTGGLIGYGVNLDELWYRGAYFVDKILKGAKPADLPVEQATKFVLAINLKTAKALGLTMPPTLLARADEVIE